MPVAVIGFVFWILFTLAIALSAVHWQARRDMAHRTRAVNELLAEHGTSRAPGETTKQALVRVRAEESMRPLKLASAAPSPMRLPAPSRSGFSRDSWHD